MAPAASILLLKEGEMLFPTATLSKVAWLTLAAALLRGGEREFDVDGVVVPPRGGVAVLLSNTGSSFIARSRTDGRGGFRFGKIEPGEYTVWICVPEAGEVLQSLDVGPGTADAGNRIEVELSLSAAVPVPSCTEGRHRVTVRDLAIPAKARKEYAEAVKRLAAGDAEGAAARLRRAVSLAPQYWAAWNELGTIAYHAGRYSEAEACFAKAHETAPEEFYPVSNLGGVLLNLGRYREALEYNTAAVRQRPKDVLANSQTGLNYLLLNQLDKALKYLKEAKRLDPWHFTHPQRFLAEIYLKLSNRAGAAAELEDFVKRHPGAPEAEAARRKLAALR